jgi:hypothetical protein
VRTLSRRALNRALLARQLLLERSPAPLPRAVERVGGIQAQYAPSMYVGLWSRLEGFERAALTRALERRSVVQGTLMRMTIHLVSRADYRPLALAVRDARRASWLRTARDAPPAGEMAAAASTLRERLGDGTLHRKDIEALVGKRLAGGVGLWLDVVRAPPSGTWERRRADLYAAADAWLGPPDHDIAPDAAIDHLVRRYLAGFGPATEADVVSFTGLPLGTVRPALERLQLRQFRAEEGGEPLLDIPRAALPDPETPAPPRLLPTWDATLLVHARRTGVLPEEHRSRVFSIRNPHSVPTFLVDGAVAGAWRYEAGAVRLEPWRRLDRADERALHEEADRLAAFHA